MSRYIAKYVNLEKSKRPTFRKRGSTKKMGMRRVYSVYMGSRLVQAFLLPETRFLMEDALVQQFMYWVCQF